MTDIEAVVKGLSGVAIALMIVVGLFLVLRHIALWYWRVDEQVALLREIRDLLKHQYVAAVRDGEHAAAGPISADPDDGHQKWWCTTCGAWRRYRMEDGSSRCIVCGGLMTASRT